MSSDDISQHQNAEQITRKERLQFQATQLQKYQETPSFLFKVWRNLVTEFNDLDLPHTKHLADGEGNQSVVEITVKLMERYVSDCGVQNRAMQCLTQVPCYNHEFHDPDKLLEPFPETLAILSAEKTIALILKVWVTHPNKLAFTALMLLDHMTNQFQNIAFLTMDHRRNICGRRF
jgi:hypothetical protein